MPSRLQRLCAAGLLAASCLGPSAFAQQDARARDEIQHLLDYLARSGCQFNRNGTWYDAAAARDHLKDKFDYLQKRDMVPNAQAFIERAAAKSSVSGQAYQVRCGNTQPEPSSRWLGAELERYRALQHGPR